MSTLKAIRKLTEDERSILLYCLRGKIKEWRDDELTPEEEDHLIDMNVLYHNISTNQLSIDFPEPEVEQEYPASNYPYNLGA